MAEGWIPGLSARKRTCNKEVGSIQRTLNTDDYVKHIFRSTTERRTGWPIVVQKVLKNHSTMGPEMCGVLILTGILDLLINIFLTEKHSEGGGRFL